MHVGTIAYTMYACKLTYVSGSATTLLDIHCVSFIFLCLVSLLGWLGSRVVSVLDSGAECSGFKSQSRRCRVTVSGKLFTPIVPLFTKQQNW